MSGCHWRRTHSNDTSVFQYSKTKMTYIRQISRSVVTTETNNYGSLLYAISMYWVKCPISQPFKNENKSTYINKDHSIKKTCVYALMYNETVL
jgi:hypothetical protein